MEAEEAAEPPGAPIDVSLLTIRKINLAVSSKDVFLIEKSSPIVVIA